MVDAGNSPSSFQIVLEPGAKRTTHPCRLCGCFFETQEIEAKAYLGVVLVGRVCLDCLQAGPRGLSMRIRQHVEALRTESSFLESLQRKCRQGKLQMPSFTEWQGKNQLEDSLRLEATDESS